MIRFSGRLLLVLALLAGWQAALVHPVEHVGEHGELVHLGHGHDREPGSVCDALDDLTAFAPLLLSFFLSEIPPSAPKRQGHLPLRSAEAPPFLSQGPPPVL